MKLCQLDIFEKTEYELLNAYIFIRFQRRESTWRVTLVSTSCWSRLMRCAKSTCRSNRRSRVSIDGANATDGNRKKASVERAKAPNQKRIKAKLTVKIPVCDGIIILFKVQIPIDVLIMQSQYDVYLCTACW